jgi:Zinc finger, C3HC4 type (RING finger)
MWHLLSKNAREFDPKPYVYREKRSKRKTQKRALYDNLRDKLNIVTKRGKSFIDFGDETDETKCLVCCATIRDVVFRPCHHICVCLECSKKLRACPLCRQKCTAKIQIQSLKCFECHQEPHEFCATCARLNCETCDTRCNCTKFKIYNS